MMIMKIFRTSFIFFVLALTISAQCFAIQNHNLCCQSQILENYYVDADDVYIVPQGIFVILNGRLVQVNFLSSDERGVFVPAIEMSREFIYCSICGHWFEPDEFDSHDCRKYKDPRN